MLYNSLALTATIVTITILIIILIIIIIILQTVDFRKKKYFSTNKWINTGNKSAFTTNSLFV